MSDISHPPDVTHRNWRALQPTPARLVVVLFALEGLLMLSERFRWFGFNERKGWTVLIGVASAAVTLCALIIWLAAARIFKWRVQFTLRTLLAIVFTVAIPCQWLALSIKNARRQANLVDASCDNDSGYSIISYSGSSACPWLNGLLGNDFFDNVCYVSACSDAGLKRIAELDGIQALDLKGSTITDSGMVELESFKDLARLELQETQITDAGLKHLKNLTKLQDLNLIQTRITDEGITRLRGLTDLKQLDLNNTGVTDAGVECLKGMKDLELLGLDGTRITDAGISKLEGLTKLWHLEIERTEVTDVGAEKLATFPNLKSVQIGDTKVTAECLERLRLARPNLAFLKGYFHF